MVTFAWLWVVFTLLAAGGQTVRNAMQRELTASLGTVGATHVRFLFGFPFALLSLLGVALITGVALPRPNLSYWPWLLVGALAQIAATALMLAAMGGRSFVVVVAYIKTEPIQVAIFGLIFLGGKCAARNDRSAEQPKEVGADLAGGDLFGVASARQIDDVEPISRDVLKCACLPTPDVELGRRRPGPRTLGRGIQEHHEPVRIRVG